MEIHEINFRLKSNNTSQSEIAKQLNVSPNTVNNVLSGRGKSQKIASAVADAIGFSLEEVFPEYSSKAA